MNSSTNSQDSTDNGEAERRGTGDGGHLPGDRLLPGETDESVYTIKHLNGVQITIGFPMTPHHEESGARPF